MRVVMLNKKNLGVTVIIIGLMLILLGFEKKFDGRLKFVALLQNNITSLRQYEGLQKKLVYKLPEDWSANEKKFQGGEIIYHNEYLSSDYKIHGFVQVWNLKEELKEFLYNSKETAGKNNIYKGYSIVPIRINDENGYLIQYEMKTTGSSYYKAYEYFIKKDNKIIRFSFFVREDNFKENMPTNFKTIVETLSYKE